MQVNLDEAAKSYPNNDLVPITFTEDEAKRLSQPHGDALVVELEIAKHKVMRNLIDGGSSADILFTRAFSQLKFPDKTLKPVKSPLRGFSGNEVMPLGRIMLRVVFGTAPCQASVSVNFLFPTPNGIGVVDEAQTVSRETYELATTARFRQTEPTSTKRRNPGECLQVGTVDHVDYGVITGAIQLGSLDPRDDFYEQRGSPVEDLEEIQFSLNEPGKTFKIGRLLQEPLRARLIEFLRKHENDFAWTHHDIPGIDPTVMVHSLAVDPKAKPIKQKRRSFNPERYAAINTEVEKLVEAGSIREVQYPEWVANVVLVKKSSGKWRVCTDFTDLNKACPKDSFPLPRIDQLVDATVGHELLSFMDAYSGYNQIRMNPKDEEKTSFITNQGLYCYNVMPFGLKNAGATYQRLVNEMFAKLLGRSMEVYVDDMLVKSLQAEQHIQYLDEAFQTLG
ncbi:hypothetical protein UlMin_016530 [Ulmus minor]